MICSKCQREIPDDAVLCCYCGKKFVIDRRAPKRGNGQGTAFKRGAYWYCQVTTGKKESPPIDLKNPPPEAKKPRQMIRKTKGGFKTKAEALAYCSTLAGKKEEPKVTLQQLYDAWEPWYSPRIASGTMAGYKSAYAYFSSLSDRNITEITAADLQGCMDACDKGKRTHQNMKVVAGLLWKYAKDKHYVAQVESENLYTGKGRSKKREALTEKEVELFRNAIGKERYADYIYALCYLGYRPGEFLEIRKGQVFKEGKTYFIREGIKTEAGRDRIIPVHKNIESIIKDRLKVEGTDLLFPMYVFDRKGAFCGFKQMTDSYFREFVFKRISGRIGVTEGKVPYSARHTFSNKLKAATGDDIDKAALMGHSDYTFTQTHYQTTNTDELKAVVNSMK